MTQAQRDISKKLRILNHAEENGVIFLSIGRMNW